MVEKIGHKNYTRKVLVLTTKCQRKFFVSAHDVISNYLDFCCPKDMGLDLNEEYARVEGSDDLLKDWLLTNMDWYQCKSLVHFNSKLGGDDLARLEVEKISIRIGEGPFGASGN